MSERLAFPLPPRRPSPPRCAHARLYIAYENYAVLYTMVEPVDQGFLRRVYNNDKGISAAGWAFEYRFESLGPDPGAYFPVPLEPKIQ